MVGLPLKKSTADAADAPGETGRVWRLISTWDRTDSSTTRTYRWTQRGRPPGAVARPFRPDRTHPPVGVDLGARAAAALAPVVASHGIAARAQPQGGSVVWCSSARVVGQEQDPDDSGWCTDLWVHVDQSARTITVDLEGHGLAEHLTGRTHWDGPIAVDLADDLDEALAVVAGHLDRLCDAVILPS